MGRLASILARAADASASLEMAVDQDVSKYIDRVQQVHKRREDVFLRKHSELDAAVTDLAEFEHELEDFGKNDHSGAGGSSSGSAYDGTNPNKA